MRKVFSVFLAVILLLSTLITSASAKTYSTEYPDIFNSGTPVWLQCTVRGYGEYVVLLDPNTNLQSFGFDSFEGYNLINNTGATINGRAYSLTDSSGYVVRFPSYYCMQFKEPGSNISYTWTDVYITNIIGTTLDLIDYHGDRGNDFYANDISDRQLNTIVCTLLFALLLFVVVSLVFKPRLFRM